MSFKARLEKAELFKKILDGVKELVKDANFDVSSAGLMLQAMDTSHVALVHLCMRKGCFDKFKCEKTLSLGINMTNMAKILKCANNDDKMTLKASEDGDTVIFTFESSDEEKFSEFKLKLTEIEGDELQVPETEYTATINMPSAQFKKICADLSQLGDTVTIACTEEGVTFTVSGEIGNGSVTVKQSKDVDKDDEENTNITLSNPVTLTFALKYLNYFCKSSSLDKSVTLSLSTESPLLVEYKFSEDGYIRFFLAPKIDEEEEIKDEEDDDDDLDDM